MYTMYLVGYQKAMAFHKLTKKTQHQQDEEVNINNNKIGDDNEDDSKTRLIQQQYKTDTESEVVNLKIELVSDILLWCDNYFYATHQSCSMEFRGVSVVDSLKDLLNVHKYLSQRSAREWYHQGDTAMKSIETEFNHDLIYEV